MTCEAYGIEAILLFNKVDTLSAEEFGEVKYLAEMYREIGYTCIGISAKTGKRHGMIKRTPKQIRNKRGTSLLSKPDSRIVKKFLPYS